MPTEAVSLRREAAGPLPRLAAERARAAAPPDAPPDLSDAQQVAQDLGPWVPLPMQGDTLSLWECLASLGAVDLTVARVTEPHLDALAILREARRHGAGRATRTGRPARPTGAPRASGRCTPRRVASDWSRPRPATAGRSPASSRGARWPTAPHTLSSPPGSTTTSAGSSPSTSTTPTSPLPRTRPASRPTWAARGLDQVRSTPIAFDHAPAVAICQPQWYLTRPGFSWGGIGVAAIWYGASVGLARTLRAAAEQRDPDQVALLHLGAVDTALARARAVLVEAAQVADDADTEPAEAVLVTQRARQVVADTADEILGRVGHALGPAPLTGDEDHARRVADLTVYLRQHHAERDLARQGEQVLGDPGGWRWW